MADDSGFTPVPYEPSSGKLHRFGVEEGYIEAYIPLNPDRRGRSERIWREMGS